MHTGVIVSFLATPCGLEYHAPKYLPHFELLDCRKSDCVCDLKPPSCDVVLCCVVLCCVVLCCVVLCCVVLCCVVLCCVVLCVSCSSSDSFRLLHLCD